VVTPGRNSGSTREARAFGARAKHALVCTREARALGGACEARALVGTREARAFAGFNEHPLVNKSYFNY